MSTGTTAAGGCVTVRARQGSGVAGDDGGGVSMCHSCLAAGQATAGSAGAGRYLPAVSPRVLMGRSSSGTARHGTRSGSGHANGVLAYADTFSNRSHYWRPVLLADASSIHRSLPIRSCLGLLCGGRSYSTAGHGSGGRAAEAAAQEKMGRVTTTPARQSTLSVFLSSPENNLANWISVARAASGPLIAYYIIESAWTEALVGVTLAGFSDWLDGYVARRWGLSSVLGSYLDPAGDKIVVACTVGALGWVGILPGWLVGVIIGRDVVLGGGALLHRAWTVRSEAEATEEGLPGGGGVGVGVGKRVEEAVKPLYISKVNTALQFALTGGCIVDQLNGGGVLHPSVLLGLGGATCATTAASMVGYVAKYRQVLPSMRR